MTLSIRTRHLAVIGGLLVASAAAMLVERAGFIAKPNFILRGDLQREIRWLSQFGQTTCTVVAAVLIWQLDSRRRRTAGLLLVALLSASLSAAAIKHLTGRARPVIGAPIRFTGPFWNQDESKESFPSGHSASAMAVAVVLSTLYPRAKTTFWSLALACAILRYVTGAHWPSDVFAGLALGYAVGRLTCWGMLDYLASPRSAYLFRPVWPFFQRPRSPVAKSLTSASPSAE